MHTPKPEEDLDPFASWKEKLEGLERLPGRPPIDTVALWKKFEIQLAEAENRQKKKNERRRNMRITFLLVLLALVIIAWKLVW